MIDIGAGDKANALVRIHKGLLSVPALSAPEVEAHEFAPVVRAFCDSEELERAAKKFGQAQAESWLEPVFTELERLELKDVPWTLSPDEVLLVAGQRPAGWEYRGNLSLGDIPFVRTIVVIGAFNKGMDWFDMLRYSDEHQQYGGSGAWVRAAYVRARPDYDGKGPIAFPKSEISLWADLHEKRGGDSRHFPGLWHDNGKCGVGSLDWVKSKWSAGRRVAFIDLTDSTRYR